MAEDQSQGQMLEEKLTKKYSYVWQDMTESERQESFNLAERYRIFLDQGKTERESIRYLVQQAKAAGFRALSEYRQENDTLKPGDKVYVMDREKQLVLMVIGQEPLEQGANLIASHVDSPRLDLKPNPLYEEEGLAWLKTHYYGGIKKFHWVQMPLALHGVVITADGQKREIVIGEDPQDPIFTITDILPHLAKEQMEKKIREAITGESLNILIGGIPYPDDKVKQPVKLAILEKLHQQYGITEEDFVSAEIEAVPAGKARDVGLDRALIGAYGQDDRVCAWASWEAISKITNPPRTAVALFVDKEETGSAGNTGMQGNFLELVMVDVAQLLANSDTTWRNILSNSKALSADVNAAFDPNFGNVFDKLNSSRLGKGVVLTKYTGSGGKGGTSDAHAEFVGEVRRLFNQHKIIWQTGELGAVDQGGGGTIAMFMARYGMEVLDCGVALLGMHSPLELASKGDVYMLSRGYQVFFDALT